MSKSEILEKMPRYKSFTYRTSLDDVRGRSAMLHSGNKPSLDVSAPLEFKGDPGLWSPEDFFVASIEVCLMLTFVGIAEKNGVKFVSYSSTAEGLLEWRDDSYRFTRVVVRPSIVIDDPDTRSDVMRTLQRAHATCLIARSIRTFVEVEPSVTAVSAHMEV